MTKLLVSVRDSQEAIAALAGGAAVIDVKEPRNGSLGAAGREQLEGVRSATAGLAPLSAALGELAEGLPVERLDVLSGFSYAKVGLSRCRDTNSWPHQWSRILSSLPNGVSLVAVVYADHARARAPRPEEVIQTAHDLGISFLLIDTFDKQAGSVFQHLDRAQLSEVVMAAREHEMTVAIAGSLTLELLPQAIALCPELIAVRGAVCRSGRSGQVDASLVRQLVERLSTPGL